MSNLPPDTFTHCETLRDIQFKFGMPRMPIYQLEFFLDIVPIKKNGGTVFKVRKRSLNTRIYAGRHLGKTRQLKQYAELINGQAGSI